MLSILKNRSYRHLLAAQVIALLGTGLMTVALALLAYELAGESAGTVLGTAFAIKMIAYVGISPIAQAFANHLPRRTLLVLLDLVRASVALCLPFVTETWQIYVLIFLLQSASAGFTPAFQATIPDILPNEEDYTKALSLSRLAYDIESLVSPAIAAALLTVISFENLFAGTGIGFLLSAALVISVTLPSPIAQQRRSIWERTTRGFQLYLATPRLRGLLSINLAVAAAGAIVIINTVVIVKANMGLSQTEVAWALAAFGGGSMLAAFSLPPLLEKVSDRTVMLAGVSLLTAGTLAGAITSSYAHLVIIWFIIGVGYSTAQTPSGRLLRRSSHPEDRPALFAAQFALSHACWLVCYPLVGILGAALGMPTTFVIMSMMTLLSIALTIKLWPAGDPSDLVHTHPELPHDHPHLRKHSQDGQHKHTLIIDDLHRHWP